MAPNLDPRLRSQLEPIAEMEEEGEPLESWPNDFSSPIQDATPERPNSPSSSTASTEIQFGTQPVSSMAMADNIGMYFYSTNSVITAVTNELMTIEVSIQISRRSVLSRQLGTTYPTLIRSDELALSRTLIFEVPIAELPVVNGPM